MRDYFALGMWALTTLAYIVVVFIMNIMLKRREEKDGTKRITN